jgi:hypothetical protein
VVKAFPADGPDESLREGIGAWRGILAPHRLQRISQFKGLDEPLGTNKPTGYDHRAALYHSSSAPVKKQIRSTTKGSRIDIEQDFKIGLGSESTNPISCRDDLVSQRRIDPRHKGENLASYMIHINQTTVIITSG